MKHFITLVFFISFSQTLAAQTGIGTTTPNASAKLDVYSTDKGFLPPRVTLTSATVAAPITLPAEGLLVYNLGSVGLQAGYYYWNGASWATIATASSAGNGVTAMDMVKLYSKAYSTTVGDIAESNGYSFTVPVSGRYLFDFASSGYANSATFTMTFKVRQGTSDLGTDAQTSSNNTVHVEYNGKMEVNLQAGTTYNVVVISTGIRNSADYDRVYYKLVAGNLPVTGQSVDYIQASLTANQTLAAAGNIIFNKSSGAGITLTSGGFELKANKTYKLEAALGGSSTGYGYYAWVDNANNLLTGGSVGVVMKAGSAYTDAPQDKAIVFYTPITNMTVYLRVLTVSGNIVAHAPPAANNYSSTWAAIQQVGASAFVNPWILSGTNTFNTSGNVGIGTNAPTQTLDISGTAKITTTPAITTATSVLVKDPTTSQISEQPISFITGVAKFIRNTSQSSITNGTTVLLNTSSVNTINNYASLNTTSGIITLQPGTYELNGSAGAGTNGGSGGDNRSYSLFYNGTAYVGTGGVSESGPAGNYNSMPQNNANFILTVAAGQTATISLRTVSVVNVGTISDLGDFGSNADAGRAWVVVRKYN